MLAQAFLEKSVSIGKKKMPLKGEGGVLRRKLSKENQYTENLQGIPGTSVFPSNDRLLLGQLEADLRRWDGHSYPA